MTLPKRTCVGCGRKAPQAELLRFTAADGALVSGRTNPGRGAYTCRRLACFERAVDRRAFARVLRRTVSIDALLIDPGLSRLYTGA
ncbi:MAG: YlxR family protein [Gaiellaceae bacterium MAG52_C11]|nr:YlxR family protein [Candidatus Gaiellasilicea maunaloa]